MQNRFAENAIAVFIKQMDQAIANIHAVLDNVFKQPDVQQAESLFRHIWQYLVVNIAFPSHDDLDQYYNNIKINLDQYIHEYQAQGQGNPVSDSNKKLLSSVVSLYRVLAKYKFILMQLKKHHEENTLEEDIITWEKECPGSGPRSIDFAKIRNDIKQLGSLYETLASKLKARGYLGQTGGFESAAENRYPASEEFEKLNDLILELPAISAMNETIGKLAIKKSDGEEDKAEIDVYSSQLNDNIKTIMDTNEELRQQLTICLEPYQKSMEDMIAERDLIKQKIEIFTKNKDFFRSFTVLADLIQKNELKNAYAISEQISDKPPSTWWGWGSTKTASRGNETQNQLEKIFSDLEEKHKNFIASYLRPISSMEFLRSGQILYGRLKELNFYCQSITEKIHQINRLWLFEQKTTSAMLDKLRGHIKSTDEMDTEAYVLSFLRRHWGKILMGLLAGGSSSLAVSFLVSLEPAYFAAFCLAGTTLAGSAATGVGVASDHCSSKNNDDPDEIMLVTMGDQEELNSEDESDAELLGPLMAIREIHEDNTKKQPANKTVSWSQWFVSPLSLWKKSAPPEEPTQTSEREPTRAYSINSLNS